MTPEDAIHQYRERVAAIEVRGDCRFLRQVATLLPQEDAESIEMWCRKAEEEMTKGAWQVALVHVATAKSDVEFAIGYMKLKKDRGTGN